MIKKARTDWKREVDKQISEKFKLREELEASKKKNQDEYKMYQKNFHEMRKDKNYWIRGLAILLILAVIALVLTQQKLSNERSSTTMLISAGLNCQVDLNHCEVALKNVSQRYEEGFYEVVRDEPMGGLFDCCWPSDCAESKNNPEVCSCEYNIQCSGWN